MAQHTTIATLGLFITAAAIRVVAALQLDAHPLLQPDAGLDTTAYVLLARRVVAGDLLLGPGMYFVSPLYIYFLAGGYALTGTFTAVRLTQAMLGVLTVICVFVMTREWYGRRAAWIAAAALTFSGVFVFYEALLMQSALDAVLTAGALLAVTFGLKRSARWFLLAGILFGLQTLNRPNILLPVLGMLGWLIVRSVRSRATVKRHARDSKRARPFQPLAASRFAAAWLAVGLSIALSSALARNAIVTGEWSALSSHGGLNLYIGNHESATGLYVPVPNVRPDIDGQREDTRRVAEHALGRALSDSEVSDYFADRAVAWVSDEPLRAFRLFVKKLWLVFHGDHVPLPYSYTFYAWDAQTILRWLVVNPWLVMPLGLAGLLLAAPAGRRADFALWASFIPVYAISVAVFFVAERYRIPVFVPLYVVAGGFLDHVWSLTVGTDRMRRSRRLAAAAAAVAIAFAIVNWPTALADSREGDRLRMVVLSAREGKFDEADRWGALAANQSHDPARVHAAAGNAFMQVDQPARALPYLQRARALGALDPKLLSDLAEAEADLGNTAAALAALSELDRLLASSPAILDVDTWIRAGRVAATLRDVKTAERLFQHALTLDPNRAEVWAQLGFARLFDGQFATARDALERSVRLDPKDPVALGGLAFADLRLGRLSDAEMHAMEALRLNPDESFARQVMAILR